VSSHARKSSEFKARGPPTSLAIDRSPCTLCGDAEKLFALSSRLHTINLKVQ
jgi:hypothetical protein